MADWLVVGLGNPGPTYARHRHNVGVLVVEELARRDNSSLSPARLLKADTATVRVPAVAGGDPIRLLLARTRTFMNESGGPTGKLLGYHKLAPERLIVIHDELDIDFGQLRVKLGGGDNGHNGLKSIRKVLGTGDFYRVRVGIGRPPGRQEPADFVLSNFPAALGEELALEIGRAADAVSCLVSEGLAATQTRFNS